MDTELVEAALRMALEDRQPPPGLLHHSDQGSQYTATHYLSVLTTADSQLSMSRVATPYDNAVMESFFSTLKTECVTRPFRTRAEARQDACGHARRQARTRQGSGIQISSAKAGKRTQNAADPALPAGERCPLGGDAAGGAASKFRIHRPPQ